MCVVYLDSEIPACSRLPGLLEFFGKVEVVLSTIGKTMFSLVCTAVAP